jgi:hypothetical protein
MPEDASSGLCFAIVNGTEEIYAPYWLEENTSEWIVVWLNVSSIPASSELDVKVYYNASTESNVSAVFMAYADAGNYTRDFEVKGGGTVSVVNGLIKIVGVDAWTGLVSRMGLSRPLVLEWSSQRNPDTETMVGWSSGFTVNPGLMVYHNLEVNNPGALRKSVDGVSTSIGDVNNSKLFDFRITVNSSGYYEIYRDGVLLSTGTYGSDGYNFSLQSYRSSGALWIGYARARKYASPEPTTYKVQGETPVGFGSLEKSMILSPLEDVYEVYVDYVVYIEENDSIVNLTLTLDGVDYVNTTTVYNASNYTFQDVYTSSGEHSYNFTVCLPGACYTSWTVSFKVEAIDLYLTIRDEDTGELVNETATIIAYRLPDLTIIEQVNATGGERHIVLPAGGIDYLITVYTNESYVNQRRLLYLSGGQQQQNTTVYLLKNGRGIAQSIKVYDRTTYQGVENARIRITLSNRTIDYGIADSQGRLYSYLDPYKIYALEASADGYKTSTHTLTPSTSEFVVYLTKIFEEEKKLTITWSPSASILGANESHIPMVTIEGYDTLRAIDFIAGKSRTYIDYYKLTGKEEPGVVEHEHFDLTDLSWCNSTWLCTTAGDTISFRYSQSFLEDFGDKVVVQYNATMLDGRTLTGEKTYLFSDFKFDVAGLFTDTQKPWVGLGLMLFGTFTIVKWMVGIGFSPSVRQVGMIMFIMLILAYKLGFFPQSYLILGGMVYIGVVLGGRLL